MSGKPEIRRKTMRRDEWTRITARRYAFETESWGEAGLMRIDGVRAPQTVFSQGREIVIADRGYCWLQLAPNGKNWWLTVMYDREDAPVQAYFDITAENGVQSGGASWFDDLFLDIVVSSGAGVTLEDEADLERALAEGVVTQEQAALARETARALMAVLPGDLFEKCETIRRRLAEKLSLT